MKKIAALLALLMGGSLAFGAANRLLEGTAIRVGPSGGTLTLPNTTDTLVGKATTDTLTNKTLSGASNTLSNIGDGSLTTPYLKADGTRALSGAWNAGQNITAPSFIGALTGNASTATSATSATTATALAANPTDCGAGTKATAIDASGNLTCSSVDLSSDTATTALPATKGGTGQTTATTGDTLYASAANTISKLAIGTQNQVLKTSNGLPAWGSVPSQINYLSANPDAEVDTTGWTMYDDAAAAPVDGTGGVLSSTWTRVAASTLRGTGYFLFTHPASNVQGEGVCYAFTLDNADKAKPLQVAYDYQVVSGTYADGDLTDYIIDVTNSTVIQPAPYTILSATAGSTQKRLVSFQTSASGTSYKYCIHAASTSASAFTVGFDNFTLGPTYQSYGAVATDEVAATLTPNGFGTTSAQTSFVSRNADKARFRGIFTAGTVAASTGSISLPAGYVIDSAKMPATARQRVGVFTQVRTAAGPGTSPPWDLFYDGSDTAKVYITTQTGSNVFTKTNGSSLISTGDSVSFEFEVPISGWSSNVQVSSDADTRVVAARYYRSSAQSINNASEDIVNFDTKVYDTHNAVTTGASWKFTAPVPGYYKLHEGLSYAASASGATRGAIFYKNGSTRITFSALRQPSGTFSASASYWTASDIVYLNAGDYIDGRAYQDTGGALNLTGAADESYITIERLSGPAQIAASEKVYLLYTNNGGTALTADTTNIDWTTKVVDSHGAWGVSNTTFTAPRAGFYLFQGNFRTTAGVTAAVSLYVNGVIKLTPTDNASKTFHPFAGAYYLNAGDLVTFRSDTNCTLSNTSGAQQSFIIISSQGGI